MVHITIRRSAHLFTQPDAPPMPEYKPLDGKPVLLVLPFLTHRVAPGTEQKLQVLVERVSDTRQKSYPYTTNLLNAASSWGDK